jgi:hypothetical protein
LCDERLRCAKKRNDDDEKSENPCKHGGSPEGVETTPAWTLWSGIAIDRRNRRSGFMRRTHRALQLLQA